ncbi:hypothetical protein MJI69_30165, partial [Salmonella enterica subsp. enterica serovar Anatum]|nr:hypothetical protein [Salmonella enterica subsp. enterica serovar Anatum]
SSCNTAQHIQKSGNKHITRIFLTMFGNNVFTRVKRSENKKMAGSGFAGSSRVEADLRAGVTFTLLRS